MHLTCANSILTIQESQALFIVDNFKSGVSVPEKIFFSVFYLLLLNILS